MFQSTLPYGERRHNGMRCIRLLIVSIHTPRVGSDRGIIGLWLDGEEFQSTLPVWGATRDKLPKFNNNGNFNPHSPYGERLPEAAAGRIRSAFQSTLPVWGATAQIHKKIFAIDKRLHILHKVQMAYLGLSPCLDQYLLRFAKKPARTPPKNSGSYPFAPL